MKVNSVYWIHRENTTDPKIDGYIGVSSNSERRFKYYKQCIKSGKDFFHINKHLQSALRKYQDIRFDVIYNGDEESCLLLEELLRPECNIGWNVVPGGGKPPQGPHQNQHFNSVRKYGEEKWKEMMTEYRSRSWDALSEEHRMNFWQNGQKAMTEKRTFESFSSSTKGKFWWNNGDRDTRSFECPGERWVRGRLCKPNLGKKFNNRKRKL